VPTNSKNIFGYLPDRANKRKIASQKRFPIGLSYPIAKNNAKPLVSPPGAYAKADYFTKSTGKDLITGMLRQLFLTRPGERVMLPAYGLKLDRYLFEPLNSTLFEMLKQDILNCINTYVPFISVIKLSIFASRPDLENNGLTIYLTVRVKDNNLIPPFEVGVSVG